MHNLTSSSLIRLATTSYVFQYEKANGNVGPSFPDTRVDLSPDLIFIEITLLSPQKLKFELGQIDQCQTTMEQKNQLYTKLNTMLYTTKLKSIISLPYQTLLFHPVTETWLTFESYGTSQFLQVS